MTNHFCLLFLPFSFAIPDAIAGSYEQQVKLYKTVNCQGIPFETKGWVLKFPLEGWDDSTYSVQLIGTWIFYEHMQWNAYHQGKVEYIFSIAWGCHQFQLLRGKVSSFQYVGMQKDYRASSLTIFKWHSFQGGYHGQVMHETSGSPVSLGSQQSIIITGKVSWALFPQENYKGEDVCIAPPSSSEVAPFFVADVAKIGLSYDFTRSVKPDCTMGYYQPQFRSY